MFKVTAALSTVPDYNNNKHLIQEQLQLQDNHLDREQDSFRMLAFHLSERITEINDILRST